MESNLHPIGVQITYGLKIKRGPALSATRTSLAGIIERTLQEQARVLLAKGCASATQLRADLQ